MSQPRRLPRFVLPLAILLLLALAAAVMLLLLWLRGRAAEDRPVVFFHRPLNMEEASVGDGLVVHVTARSDHGLWRLELWADGALTAQVEPPDSEPRTTLLLTAPWEPLAEGWHVLLARAVGANGSEAGASIAVRAVDEGPEVGRHTVAEGETVESVAADYGVPPVEVSELNPDLPASGPAAGDQLLVPLWMLPSDDPAPAEPSEPGPEAPDLLAEANPVPEGPVRVRLEALGLEVDAAYESVHCYASVGLHPPAWIPDADHDPSTDESFVSLGGLAWDIASHFSGNAAPSFPWPGDQPLPFEINCVGVRGEGSDAVELGRVALSIPASEWDGVTREAGSGGGEGSFTLAYRVGPGEIHTLELDLSMAPPFNLRIDDRRQELRWDYEPIQEPEPEPGIHGFLIFLNDTLVSTEHYLSRASRIPDQWFTPPCGEDYVFTVRSYIRPYPEGPYSVASNSVTISGEEAGPEGCVREFLVEFETLETGDMGGDGDRDPGDMGPVYGGFYANDVGAEFDGRCQSPGGNVGYICGEHALDNHTRYDVIRLPWTDPYGASSLFIEVLEDEWVTLRYSVLDEDTGWGNEDDTVCTGFDEISWYRLESGEVAQGTIESEQMGPDGQPRCRVEYTLRPAPGGPVGTAGGGIPLPWLDLEDVTFDRAAGQLQLHIRNTGTAAWANHDLTVEVTTRDGGLVGRQIWPEEYIDPGAVRVYTASLVPPRGAGNACVHLDPDDAVLERYEASGALYHGPICPILPDLTIPEVTFDPVENRLLWTVHNVGEGDAREIPIEVLVEYGNGRDVLLPSHSGQERTLAPRESVDMQWPGASLDREAMLTGYTLTVDPRDQVVEENETNNTIEVAAAARLRLEWLGGRLRWYPTLNIDGCNDWMIRSSQEQTITFEAYVESPFLSRRVAGWTIERDVGWPGVESLEFDELPYEDRTYVADFDILGEEWLRVYASGELSNDNLGSASITYGPEETWGSGARISEAGRCRLEERLFWSYYPDENGWWSCGNWRLEFAVCEVLD